MKIAIFTTFHSADHAYSLNNVVVDQIKMLLRGGYKPVVIVAQGFPPVGVYKEVELREIPPVFCSNEGNLPDNYKEDIEKLHERLKEVLKDVSVCITHDVIYQPAHLIHNVAARKITELYPKLRWLHWIHSATSMNLLCNRDDVKMLINRPFPNSFICYPNTYDRTRVAKNYKTNEDLIKYVPHPIDICDYLGFHELTRQFVDEYNLLTTDVIMVYPVRLDRGKQVEYNIKLMARVKQKQKTVRLIVCDFHSTGGDKVTYRDMLRALGDSLGLSKEELIFTSEWRDETRVSCPREMVRDLFLISNVFMLPSKSETYSLVAQEASICGNLLILNFDFSPMRSIYGDEPLYYKFSSNIDALSGFDGTTETKYNDENQYFGDMAQDVLYQLTQSRIVAEKDKLRKERNLDAVFINHMEPLFIGDRI